MAAQEPRVLFVEANAMFLGAPDHQHLAQNAELPLS
jgi:hypothetical protein